MKLRTCSILFFAVGAMLMSCQKKEVVYQFDGSTTAYFQEWLLCGPFPNCPTCDPIDYIHDEKCKGFFTDYLATIGGEANAVPQRETKVVGGDQTYKWFYFNAETNKIPLNDIFEPNDMVIAYAFCQVNSTDDQKAILSVGSNDGIRVFLNGEQVHQAHPSYGRWLQPDNDFVPVNLKQGLNNFMFKVDEGQGDFGLVVRLLNYDSTLTAIRDNLDAYTELSIVSEKDKLVTQFGQPFKIGALAPGIEATTEILDSRGRRIVSKKGLPGFKLEFELADVPNGFMLARSTLETKADGKIVTEKRHFKGKLKRHPAAKMLNRDLLPVDDSGKGYLPIGTYGAPVEEYDVLKKAGYNFIVAGVSNLDKVHAAGLKAAVSVHGHGEHWFSAVRDTITKYKNHPAILCWMLYDEPGYNRADLLDIYKIYNIAYEADPYHPSYLVITTNKVYETFGRCCDVLSIDTYPVAQGNILSVGDNIKLALDASDGDQPIWHCGQMFHWPAQRYPTPQEHRFMTYSAMMRGAKGLLWYTYKGYGQYMPKDAPELWEAQHGLLAEIHDMEAFWIAPGYGTMIADGEDVQVLAMRKKSPIGEFVIAMNTSQTESITQELSMSGVSDGTLTVINEDRSVLVKAGSFKDDFAPLDVHIYKID